MTSWKTTLRRLAGVPLPNHQYSPLSNPSSQIRLLEIAGFSTKPDRRLNCKVRTWDVETAPQYHAISYTWGREEPTETIILDHGLAAVCKNCADVLRKLEHFKTSRYYWLDALCIDQKNTTEKNAQVALMGSIFHKAEHVLICPDERDDDGGYAVQTILDQLEIHRWAYEVALETPGKVVPLVINGVNIPYDVDVAHFADSLAALTSRRYFSRVWVVQEIFLARDASICFGSLKLPVSRFLAELEGAEVFLKRRQYERWVTADGMRVWRYDPKGRNPLPELLRNAAELLERRWNPQCLYVLGNLNKATLDQGTISLETLIHDFEHLNCKDPRDSIYGALALTNWEDSPPITPDYNKSAFNLAIEILHKYATIDITRKLLQNLKITTELAELSNGIALRRRELADNLVSSRMLPFYLRRTPTGLSIR